MRIVRGVKGWFEFTLRVGGLWFNVLFVGLALSLGVSGMVLAFGCWGWLQGGVDNPESNSATLRNVGLLIGGVVALVLALWRGIVAGHQADAAQRQAEVAQGQVEVAQGQIKIAQEQVELGQQGLLNERYQKGAEMLGDSVLSVRMGGIYALQRLAEERPEQYYLQIMDVLCAFVRHPTEDKVIEKGQKDRRTKLREDVQAIMDIVRKRGEHLIALEKENDFRLNFQDADLMYANIWSTDLSGANLQGANLARARLPEVNLSCANLRNANLSDSRLSMGPIRSNLYGAFLDNANLSRAILQRANLSEAHLDKAILQNANLSDANLTRAKLPGADLTDADLTGADLSESFMRDAKLAGAHLKDTSFSYAYIADVRFYDDGETENKKPARGLTQRQLDEADVDPKDTPPRLDGFVMDAETGEPLVWKG